MVIYCEESYLKNNPLATDLYCLTTLTFKFIIILTARMKIYIDAKTKDYQCSELMLGVVKISSGNKLSVWWLEIKGGRLSNETKYAVLLWGNKDGRLLDELGS